MARKPNYNLERAERQRAKDAKKAEKLKLQKERASMRKEGDPEISPDDPLDEPSAD